MWLQRDQIAKEINWDEVLDWVVINGIMWVKIPDKGGEKCIVQC